MTTPQPILIIIIIIIIIIVVIVVIVGKYGSGCGETCGKCVCVGGWCCLSPSWRVFQGVTGGGTAVGVEKRAVSARGGGGGLSVTIMTCVSGCDGGRS